MRRWVTYILFIMATVGVNARQYTETQPDSTYYSRALELILKRDYEKARSVLHQGLTFATGEMRIKSIQKIGLSWYFEGCVLKLQNKNKEAYLCFIEARKSFQEISDKGDEMSVLKQMAEIEKRFYSADEAMERYNEVVNIARQIPDTLMWIDALKGQSGVLKELGEWEEYLQLSLRLDSLMSNVGDVNIQMELNYERGDNAQNLWGNDALAESFYLKNLSLIPNLQEEVRNSQLFITSLHLCDLKIAQKKYDDALKYNTCCLSCYASEFGLASANRYSPYRNRAYIYQKMGLKDSAFCCMDSLFLSHQLKSVSMETVAGHYVQRGLLYANFDEYGLAIADYKYADSLLSVRYPEDSNSRMHILLAMANCWYHKKDFAVAKKNYSHYSVLCKSKYGDQSMEYANSLYYLANIEGFTNEKQVGCKDYRQAAILLKELIKKQLRYLPTNARTKYWNDLSDILWNMTAYAVKIGVKQEPFACDAYNALVFSKGLLLESERSMRNLLRQSGTEEDLTLYNKMLLLQSRLTEVERATGKGTENANELYSQIDQIDKQLASKCSFYGNYTQFLNTQYKDIKNALKEGEVAIDFTDFKLDSVHCYAAYVLRKEWEYPLLVPLFNQNQLDSLYNTVNNITDRLYHFPYSQSLLKLCWESLSHYIHLGETVYYVPAGTLHQLSLESVAVTSDSILGDQYHFIRLSSTREICRRELQQTGHTSAVLYGGLYYDVDLSVMDAESKKYDISRLFALRGGAMASDSVYRYLPMTQEEVNSIADLLGDCRIDTTIYTGTQGTEESFFHLDGQAPQIIHLATHGFYYTPTDAENVSRLAGYQNAMLLSGVIMSGGNAGWKGTMLPEGVLDGIMTADDISRLNLKGADLVVLSACGTGLGSINSEGVFGLQRAFKKAGVQTLVMSLWGVSDWTTKEFMVHFYRNLTENGWNKRKAFEDAKAFIRQTYPEPFYWAGFIMLD